VTVVRTLPANTAAPSVARQALRALGASSPYAEVVVSELVTNALIHGALPITLAVERTNGIFHVEISDERGDFGPRSRHGHGLQLVDAFAQSWGVHRIEGNGKIVWADIAT
jgi:anti-sigma regulatory factor (Ser/Thr protein kinase)